MRNILFSILLGLLSGFLAVTFGGEHFIRLWVSPFGEIFIRLLKMIAVPLVLISLINGIGGLGDVVKLARLGLRTLLLYLATTFVAVTLGVLLASAIRPGDVVSRETSQQLYSNYSGSSNIALAAPGPAPFASPLQPLVDIVPENLFSALASNGSMLQIILAAMLIGISVVVVGERRSAPFMSVISSLDQVVTKMITIVMRIAPLGVFALISTMVVDSSSDLSLLGALALYLLSVVVGLFAMMLLFYPLLIKLFTSIPALHFMREMLPVQMVGFTTSSSAATLATTMETSTDRLGLPESVTSFTLPVGVTLNMDGSSLYQAVAILFVAQVMDVDLSFSQLLMIIATTTISSLGSPGIPGGSIVVTMAVLASVGIPAEGLALVLGVDRPLDMLRTSVNVTGDVAVSAIVAERFK